MKVKNNSIVYVLLFFCSLSFGQLDEYGYKKELSRISHQWHKIDIPNEVFNKVKDDLSDIRIYGVTTNDTIEAPFIMKIRKGETTAKKQDFELLNSTFNENGYYFTYELPSEDMVNKIYLDFRNNNFDWSVTLAGSQDQKQWFTILENYRILSIKNEQTDYSFTDLDFRDTKYRYYRIMLKSDEKPDLVSAKISLNDQINAVFQEYTVPELRISEKKERKLTELNIDLKQRVPVSFLKVNVLDDIDFYRPINIQYAVDSVKTEQGWKYSYRTLHSDVLNSIDSDGFRFKSTLVQKLRMIIQNQDNQPLNIENVAIKGYAHELLVRFNGPATYYLAYGNSAAKSPQYDISKTLSKIPKNLSVLSLGEEQVIPKKEIPTAAPLLQNKLWLWAIMALVILVLGGFTLKMMKGKSQDSIK